MWGFHSCCLNGFSEKEKQRIMTYQDDGEGGWHVIFKRTRTLMQRTWQSRETLTLWQWHWQEEAELGLSHPVNHDTVAVTLTGGGRTRFITPSQPWHCGSDTDGRRQNSVYHTQSTMVVTSGRHTNSDGLKLNEMVVRNRTSEIIDSGCWLEIGLKRSLTLAVG